MNGHPGGVGIQTAIYSWFKLLPMLVAAVVLLTQIMEQEEEVVAVVMVETLVSTLLLSDPVMQMLTPEEVEVVHMVMEEVVL